jgi:SAM-dependent methyltransferase
MSKFKIQDERGFNQVFSPIGSTPLRATRRNDWFVEEAHRVDAKRILEIGCGTGEAAAHMARHTDAEVIGVDLSEAFLDHANGAHRSSNLRFEKLDLLGGNSHLLGKFDLIYGNGILHHLVLELASVLRTLREMTNDAGGLAFIEPNLVNPYCAFIFGTQVGRRWARLEPDEMAFTAGGLRKSVLASGWSDVNINTKDFLLPGLPAPFVRPTLAIEPMLEASIATRWLAQSHFMTARA